MIYIQSLVNVSDNSTALVCKCIHHASKSKVSFSSLADIIKVSIQKKESNSKIKKKIFFALIIHTAKNVRRRNGFFFNFQQNNILLLQDNFEPLAEIQKVPLPKEFLYNNSKKISSFFLKNDFL